VGEVFVATAPCGEEDGSRRTRTDHGGSRKAVWVYAVPVLEAKMEIPDNLYLRLQSKYRS
jgi:hypothetical protein